MRLLFISLSLFVFSAAVGQESKTDPSGNTTTAATQSIRRDSFVFGSRMFPLPADCDTNNAARCCSYIPGPEQVSCGNGTSMSWHFFPSPAAARDNANAWASQKDKQSFRKKKITCFLFDREANAWHTSAVAKDGFRYSSLYVWGEVEGKGVLVTFTSLGMVNTNNDIPWVYQQILKLKP